MGSQGILGEFEQGVLLSLLRLGEQATGGAIHDDLERRSLNPVAVTAVYVTLKRLAGKGLVSVTTDTPLQRGGRALKRFDVTPEGVAALQRSRAQLEQLWEGVTLPAESGKH